jgi:hypothetical protein
VSGFTQAYSSAVPVAPHSPAKAAAWDVVIKPEGSGRLAVRFIIASNFTSRIWLIVFAQPLHSRVPAMAQAKS